MDLPLGLSEVAVCYGGRIFPISIQVGNERLRPAPKSALSRQTAVTANNSTTGTSALLKLVDRDVIVVGSAPDCTIVLQDPTVEAHHAQVSVTARGQWTIRRLDAGALMWLDGKPIVRAGLTMNSLLTFGGCSLLWPDDFVAATSASPSTASVPGKPSVRIHYGVNSAPVNRALTVPAAEFSRAVIGFAGVDRPHLGPVDLLIESGQLYAVVGPSGAGKSTFCRAILNEAQLREGYIKVAGSELEKNFSPNPMNFSFVPQANILIPQLTVGETLEFAARVRLAANVSAAERAAEAADAAEQLKISHTMDQRVSSLSGGEQRRVSIAQELLTAPRLLLLDEPTSGLDDGLDRVLMRQLRDLARGDGRPGVVVVTHATQNLDVADSVIAIGAGGEKNGPVSAVRYSGESRDLLRVAGHSSFADFMDSLRGKRERSPSRRVSQTEHNFISNSSLSQMRALIWRDRKVDAVDWAKHLVSAVAWAALIAVLIGVINSDGMRVDGPGSNPLLRVSISLLVIISSLWALKLPINSVVSRLPVAHREQRWGVSIRLAILVRALLDSPKVIIQMALTAGLVLLAAWIVTEDAGKPTMVEQVWIGGILIVNGLACYAIGLIIGATSVNETSATNKMMVVVAAMIVLSGVMFHLPDTMPLDIVSRAVPPRVAIADIASVLDLGSTMPPESVPNAPKLDPLMDLDLRWQGWLLGQLAATYLVGIALAVVSGHRTLRRFEALR